MNSVRPAGPIGQNAGCTNSTGSGERLNASGTPSIAADTILLSGSQMPNSTALYLQGTTVDNLGQGAPFGDGLSCVGGPLISLGSKTNLGGVSHHPLGNDPAVSLCGHVAPGTTRTYPIC